jgi:hypothetical protein
MSVLEYNLQLADARTPNGSPRYQEVAAFCFCLAALALQVPHIAFRFVFLFFCFFVLFCFVLG